MARFTEANNKPASLEAASGVAFGRNKGFVVTKRALRKRPVNARRGGPSSVLVKETVREAVGFAPYERRIMELIKIGSAATFKRALKYAKKRLGTHKRGKNKRMEMEAAIQAARKK